jgi:hypothetical protein
MVGVELVGGLEGGIGAARILQSSTLLNPGNFLLGGLVQRGCITPIGDRGG